MALQKSIIHSQLDQEPSTFDSQKNTISFALNLSASCVGDGTNIKDDEGDAKARIGSFLDAVAKNAAIELYKIDEANHQLVHLPGKVLEEVLGKGGSSGELLAWLSDQKEKIAKQRNVNTDKLQFWAPNAPPKDGSTADAEASSAGAGERLRSVQSWAAPVGHQLGLTRILRIDSAIFYDVSMDISITCQMKQ